MNDNFSDWSPLPKFEIEKTTINVGTRKFRDDWEYFQEDENTWVLRKKRSNNGKDM